MNLDDFTYELPEELIAQEPSAIRDASRLLWVERSSGRLEDRTFAELPDLLVPGDLLVVNDTKVIPARLLARRESGARVELLLLYPQAAKPGVWLALATNLRKLKEGERLLLDGLDGKNLTVCGFESGPDGHKRVLVDFGGQQNVHQTLSKIGLAPLPPYIKRLAEESRQSDLDRYQTVFARTPGAVAAPTAGLHFSPQVIAGLKARDIGVATVTLHVGPGTFKPITSSLEEHTIEAEHYWVTSENAKAINAALSQGRRVIAVGTTSCRTLESAGKTGTMLEAHDVSTSLYIRPGFDFKIVKAMITNFHLSRSSLLVLVSAFAGHELIMKAYKHAVDKRYRFFSYGDAMLIT